ncbi:hypothetical protein A2U01_0016165, partial [Trifolium medium]|nr:hypothetical protein [Trifolium medium]
MQTSLHSATFCSAPHFPSVRFATLTSPSSVPLVFALLLPSTQ